MKRSVRGQRAAAGLVLLIGVIAVAGSIAAASRTDGPARIVVSSSAGDATADTTTTTAPTTTATGSPVALPPAVAPPGTEQLAGTYRGIEHFALADGHCPDLHHDLQMIVTLVGGAIWNFHADYCGTVTRGDRWSAVGTFAFTTDDGSTLTGDFTETDIVIPSKGVPYTINIRAGTRRYAGATGTCRLDNHLRPIDFAVQDQFGSLTCDISS